MRTRRHAITPLPPPGMRPKLDAGQVEDLGLVHIINLDAIAKGDAGVDVLWQVMGGMLTWHRVAEKLGRGEQEMVAQLELMRAVWERYGRTGRVLFTGPEYQLAKLGVEVQDALASIVDRHIAVEAANWSEAQIARLSKEKSL